MLSIVTALLGLLTAGAGLWGILSPESFSDSVNFPPHTHFVHDIGAFQFGIGMTLLLAMIWSDALAAALAGYLLGASAHTINHIVDAALGGSTPQTVLIAALALLSAVALAFRWRALGWVIGRVDIASTPALVRFGRQKTVLLTTYRRDGKPVGTPVSIAVMGERAYVRSFERAGKTRRIRHTPTVTVAPSTARGQQTGPATRASARMLTGTEATAAGRALARKYPMLQGVLVPLGHRLGRRKTGRTVHFALTPSGEATRVAESASDHEAIAQ